jgi:hypothetical protein
VIAGGSGGVPVGGALVALALFLWLVRAHMREGRYFDRPDFARHRVFDPAVALFATLALVLGLAVLWGRAPLVAGAVATLLIVAGAARGLARGVGSRRRAFRRDLEAVRRGNPGMPWQDLHVRAILVRHPQWGEELATRMALDYPEPDDLARVVARMEMGFRGFR